ncbi:hypothetical protein CRE_05943 [Caenorhabditis remanei]|uniref:Uncharacterized protein n=1 Tax=Caenorhabditis remanei TaxID=31234 RepID=E3MZE7_CAERE|nr:hypothetical protein CRE_05943 [Caenorhabditis remanei]
MSYVWCTKEEIDICSFAQSLMKNGSRDFMDQYLVGKISGYKVARMIHHNNIFHGANLGKVMIRFCEVMDERKEWQTLEQRIRFIKEVRMHLDEIRRTSAKIDVISRLSIYPAVHTFGFGGFHDELIKKLSFNRDYAYHPLNLENQPLNVNQFTVKQRNLAKEVLPCLTISCGSYNQQNANNIARVVPRPTEGLIPSTCSQTSVNKH